MMGKCAGLQACKHGTERLELTQGHIYGLKGPMSMRETSPSGCDVVHTTCGWKAREQRPGMCDVTETPKTRVTESYRAGQGFYTLQYYLVTQDNHEHHQNTLATRLCSRPQVTSAP